MASKTQQQLFENFLAISGGLGTGTQTGTAETITNAGDELATSLAGVAKQVSGVALHGTGGLLDSVVNAVSGKGNAEQGAPASIASTVLKSGFGLLPLVSGLFGLFGGGGQAEPPPLVKYALPASLNIQGAETVSGISDVDYDQFGMARRYGAPNRPGRLTPSVGDAADAPRGAATPQITVNVQAMDSRS